MEILRKGFGDYFDQIEFVSADLQDQEAIKKAVEDVTYVLHIASPYPMASPKNAEKEVIQPAIDGNKHILNACVGSDVQKVILTSSALTVQDFWENPKKVSDHRTIVKENKKMIPYYKSKIRAERYAFEFMDNLKSAERTFELVTIHPGVITGRALLPRADGASLGLMKNVLENKLPGVVPIYFAHVDVQDVALAHVNAIEMGRDRERYPLASGTYTMGELFDPIREEFAPKGYKVTKKEMSKCAVRIGAIFNKDARFFLSIWNIYAEVDGTFAAKELGLKYKPMKESVVEA